MAQRSGLWAYHAKMETRPRQDFRQPIDQALPDEGDAAGVQLVGPVTYDDSLDRLGDDHEVKGR